MISRTLLITKIVACMAMLDMTFISPCPTLPMCLTLFTSKLFTRGSMVCLWSCLKYQKRYLYRLVILSYQKLAMSSVLCRWHRSFMVSKISNIHDIYQWLILKNLGLNHHFILLFKIFTCNKTLLITIFYEDSIHEYYD